MLEVKVINKSGYDLPAYQTLFSAGMDLRACLELECVIGSLERVLIPTGLFIELPVGFEAQIRPRSGLALKQGLTVLNSPGTIDSDYRGEIKVLLVNLSPQSTKILPGDRIAQMVVSRHERVSWLPTEELSQTQRGQGGYGSTGKQ
jgi:dUTP pyrophosphatase